MRKRVVIYPIAGHDVHQHIEEAADFVILDAGEPGMSVRVAADDDRRVLIVNRRAVIAVVIEPAG